MSTLYQEGIVRCCKQLRLSSVLAEYAITTEGETHQDHRHEDENHIDELEPAPVDLSVRIQRHRAAHQVDEEQFHAVLRDHEQRQDRNRIHDPGQAVAEERAHIQHRHRKRKEVQQKNRPLHRQTEDKVS